MFEHLGPVADTKIKKDVFNFKIYLGFLSVAVLAFIFSLGISRGPSIGAYGSEFNALSATVVADSSNKAIVINQPSFSVFDFVIDIEEADSVLYKLKVHSNGIYDINVLGDLKLYHQGVQLGEIKEVDQDGNLYFNLKEYRLPAGRNEFSFILAGSENLELNNVLQLSLEDSHDVVLSRNGHLFTIDGDFPVSGGIISFIAKGSILTYNNIKTNQFIVVDKFPQLVASFTMTNQGETVDLEQLVLNYQELEDSDHLGSIEFVLIQDNQVLAQSYSSSEGKEVIFNLKTPLVLKTNQRSSFQVHAMSLPVGEYQFNLASAQAIGFASGQPVYLNNQLSLN
ncbi:hypothetical protein K8R42_01810, partial [bacterium]|nr:hypothetical protein [bacterium]